MSERVRISGLEETTRALLALGDLPKHDMVGALLESAEPMRQQMIQLAPIDLDDEHEGGDLKASITNSASLKKSQDGPRNTDTQVVTHVGPAGRKGAHGHLVEFGTGDRFHKNGKFVGRMPAIPFVRPAFDAEARNSIKRFAAKFKLILDRRKRDVAVKVPM